MKKFLVFFLIVFLNQFCCFEDEDYDDSKEKDLEIGENCTIKVPRIAGVCEKYKLCPLVKEAYEEFNYDSAFTLCKYEKFEPVACCPKSQKSIKEFREFFSTEDEVENKPNIEGSKMRISEKMCEQYENLTREYIRTNDLTAENRIEIKIAENCLNDVALILGGEVARPGEFPHMAAIGWENDDKSVEYRCGGSLISEKFVLTAAHCFQSIKQDPPKFVLLGVLDVNSEVESARKLIKKIIKHENFLQYKNDIALVELSESIENFEKNLRPACLWQENEIPNEFATAAGWGKISENETSNLLMKVDLNIFNSSECEKIWQQQLPFHSASDITDLKLCAGDLENKKDTCVGDSGSPLVITKSGNRCLYFIVGITAYGDAVCGNKNFKLPGVYTRVSKYLDWIESKVWPKNE